MGLKMEIRAVNQSLLFQNEWQEHVQVALDTQMQLESEFLQWTEICLNALRSGKKLLWFGNGGSAADAQHLATELTVRFKNNRPAIAAIALTTDTSALTAIGNDFGFEYLFSRQLEAIGQHGDIAIGITTSGQSPNVLKAFEQAKAMGMKTVALTGQKGHALKQMVDIALIVPSLTTARIQEMHITLGQMLCAAVESGLGFA